MKRIVSAFFLAIASVTLISSPSNSQQQSGCYLQDIGGRQVDLGYLCGNDSTSYNNRNFSTPNVFRAKIIGRHGGTPVLAVKFNGQQTYPMLLDTGASLTVINPKMAKALKLKRDGVIRVSTPSHNNIPFHTSRLTSLEAGGFAVRNVKVAISPTLPIGLLGQNFFGNYDVTIKKEYVEFRSR